MALRLETQAELEEAGVWCPESEYWEADVRTRVVHPVEFPLTLA
jgi:hypothetical protein